MRNTSGLLRRAALLERRKREAAENAARWRGAQPDPITRMLADMIAAAPPPLTDEAIAAAVTFARAEFDHRRQQSETRTADPITTWLERLSGGPDPTTFATAGEYGDAIGAWHRAHRAQRAAGSRA